MSKYESQIKEIGAPQDAVYTKLADLSNLAQVRERLNDPAVREHLKAQVSEDKIQDISQKLDTMTFDTDFVTIDMPPVGQITLRVIEREPYKCIKYQAQNSPIPLTLWIQILPISPTNSKLRVTLDAQLNMFMKMMVEKHLRTGIDRFADMLTMLPY